MASATGTRTASGYRLDLIIPVIEKDLKTLPHVVQAAKQNVRHTIGDVIIVAPDKPAIRSLCSRNGYRFVNENSVLPLRKQDIRYSSKHWERSGWMLQQLLKLSGDKLASTKHFLVIDADTVLLRPHTFIAGGQTTYYTRNWSQPEYYRTYQKLIGRKAAAPRSFVTHYMLFEKAKLRELKRHIEQRHGRIWYKAILASMNKKRQFAFSEYETYGNFVYSRYPQSVKLKAALNRALHSDASTLTKDRIQSLAAKYRSVSFHERKLYTKRLTAY
ncbi:DUF6492 family protein [Paenibacillus protaetiae]|uniref:Glycosyltransferase family 2 protein n=1 Tax=Paenibacillus protaetiae TaxID=2509456 RepID=A0A4P6EYD0_9BACL|nr:DUF6492 family protein [Paenibacillus protaetiae]QAY67263.1 hypothetical protein ET464_13500 [Paenibacillus protaetiae]